MKYVLENGKILISNGDAKFAVVAPVSLGGAVDELNRLTEREALLKSSLKASNERALLNLERVHRLLTALEASQAVLADYIVPLSATTPESALNALLGILDDTPLVTLCQGIRQLNEWDDFTDAQITFDYVHWTSVRIEDEYFIALSDGKTAWMRNNWPTDRVVYAPRVNYSGIPQPRLSSMATRKELKALEEAIDFFELESDKTIVKKVKRLRKLYKKLS